MKVAVLGNGMLGTMMSKYLRIRGYEVETFGRETINVVPMSYEFWARVFSRRIGFRADCVINCIGAIKPHFNNENNLVNNIYVNAVWPHELARWGKEVKTPVIHITTDCVFNGLSGPYDESRAHDALDTYGKSKSIGEPSNALTIRTSIIGPEWGASKSLLSWLKSSAGKEINGFTEHKWNGVTTLELSRIVDDIIRQGLYREGIYHIFSDDVNKCQMANAISSAYDLKLIVKPTVTAPCDRRLRTIKTLNSIVQPMSFEDMVVAMKTFEEQYA